MDLRDLNPRSGRISFSLILNILLFPVLVYFFIQFPSPVTRLILGIVILFNIFTFLTVYLDYKRKRNKDL